MISIVVPTLQGGPGLRQLLDGIAAQRVDEEVEVIVIDSGSTDGSPDLARSAGAKVHEIRPQDFSHGGTRNLGATLAGGDPIVFTVQDAVPVGREWLRQLTEPLRRPDGPVATYSRQLPRDGAPPHQRRYIEYRFGSEPRTQRAADPQGLTVRETTFSNVSSAIRAELIRRQPFAEDIIVGEDGEWCSRMLLLGHTIAYVPASVIRHSHDYSLSRAFRRYFDLGISSERTFLARGRSSAGAVRGEGIAFVRDELSGMWRGGERRAIPYTLAHELTRYAGFRAGAAHRRIPARLRPLLSATPPFWTGR